MRQVLLRTQTFLMAAMTAVVVAVGGWSCAAAAWPERPVTLMVTFPPGAANDLGARIIGAALSKRWNQPVVIENRPGAEGTVGAAAFALHKNDHVLLYSVIGLVTVAPLILDNVHFDVDHDLVPIVGPSAIVLAISVSGKLAVESLSDLVRVVGDKPNQLSWASGPSVPRYAFAAFLKSNNLEMNYASYRDASTPQIDLGEDRIQVLVTSWQASKSPVELGKARFLAVVNSSRASVLPNIPTARQAGHPELELDGGSAIFGWKGMPDALRDQIAADVSAVLQMPDVRQHLEATGQIIIGGTPSDLKRAIAVQRTRIEAIAKIIDLKSAN